MSIERLSLLDAVKRGQLSQFVAQEEARGVGPARLSDFERVAAAVIKAQQSEDRTSRSDAPGNSTGK